MPQDSATAPPLRVALNHGNVLLVGRDEAGAEKGISVDLAHAFAAPERREPVFVEYNRAVDVSASPPGASVSLSDSGSAPGQPDIMSAVGTASVICTAPTEQAAPAMAASRRTSSPGKRPPTFTPISSWISARHDEIRDPREVQRSAEHRQNEDQRRGNTAVTAGEDADGEPAPVEPRHRRLRGRAAPVDADAEEQRGEDRDEEDREPMRSVWTMETRRWSAPTCSPSRIIPEILSGIGQSVASKRETFATRSSSTKFGIPPNPMTTNMRRSDRHHGTAPPGTEGVIGAPSNIPNEALTHGKSGPGCSAVRRRCAAPLAARSRLEPMP
jgi:hypothetical protein